MAIWLPVLGAVIIILIVGVLTIKANWGVDRETRRELRELRKHSRTEARPLVLGDSEMPPSGFGADSGVAGGI